MMPIEATLERVSAIRERSPTRPRCSAPKRSVPAASKRRPRPPTPLSQTPAPNQQQRLSPARNRRLRARSRRRAASRARSARGPASATGARVVAIAESQLGETEQPPGSDESPAIPNTAAPPQARSPALPGARTSHPGPRGRRAPRSAPRAKASASVGALSWAQSTGRAIANGPGVVPKPGDLIASVTNMSASVRDVLSDGQIQTIEGNYENKVAANVRTHRSRPATSSSLSSDPPDTIEACRRPSHAATATDSSGEAARAPARQTPRESACHERPGAPRSMAGGEVELGLGCEGVYRFDRAAPARAHLLDRHARRP